LHEADDLITCDLHEADDLITGSGDEEAMGRIFYLGEDEMGISFEETMR